MQLLNNGKTVFSYLPDNKPDGSYDGNEFILKNNNSIKVESVGQFSEELKNLNKNTHKKIQSKNKQTTLDF